jgi:phosphate transport system permease protein
MTLYQRRKLINRLALIASSGAALFGLFWLVAILGTLVVNGVSSLNLALFTEMMPPPGSSGGLLNAIYGSVVMSFFGIVFGTPIGILAGTYLAEYGKSNPLAAVVRFINDILLSAPSIIVGLFVYELMVVPMGHFSAWAGTVALSFIVIPVVLRTTEDMLNLVPNSLREAAAGLGAAKWRIVSQVVYRAARNGMVTGVLLSVARVSGETAPLLFTALNNQFFSSDMNAPMASMPVVIYLFALSPYADWQHLAWAGALVITVSILIINIAARLLTSRTSAAQ